MAQFYGEMQGRAKKVSRLGNKRSGMQMTAASWQGAATIEMRHCETTGTDRMRIRLIPWGPSNRIPDNGFILYEGPCYTENIRHQLAEGKRMFDPNEEKEEANE